MGAIIAILMYFFGMFAAPVNMESSMNGDDLFFNNLNNGNASIEIVVPDIQE